MFGPRYHWSIIKYQSYYINIYRYIFQNPMRANIVEDGFKYPYSSFTNSSPEITLEMDIDLENKDVKSWLNQLIKEEHYLALKQKLIRRDLDIIRDQNASVLKLDLP
ncbi:MAG: hypothetical protein HQK51_16620 [Oligoflexia bacterium]|nr:hypothetical protein [Oligoflexia bacterium]